MRRIQPVIGAEKAITHYRCSECGWIVPVLASGTVEAVVRSREVAERAFDRHDCTTYGPLPTNRRSYQRWAVNGRAELRCGDARCLAEPLNIGAGGMLTRTDGATWFGGLAGTEVRLLFTIIGQPGALSLRGRIVDVERDMVRVQFLERPAELDRLVGLVAKQAPRD